MCDLPQQMSSTDVSASAGRWTRNPSVRELARWPSAWASCIQGLLRSTSERARLGALATPKAWRPSTKSMSCSAISRATLNWASTVEAPKWGVQMTRGCWMSCQVVVPSLGGSWTKTSSAAPRQRSEVRASSSAASSTIPPRAMLMIRTDGLQRFSAAASIKSVRKCCVSHIRPSDTVNKSSYGAFAACKEYEQWCSRPAARSLPVPVWPRRIRQPKPRQSPDRSR